MREAMTMIRIISALLLSFSTACALAQAGKPLQLTDLADDVPDRHVVVRGDTLWGISAKFLKEPYRWPEIWRMNKDEIKNPHRIYPGQVVKLDRSDGEPKLTLEKLEPKVYAEKLGEAIPSIPQHVIEPFLSLPLVVEENGLKDAPKIIATQEDRVLVGPGNRAYVAGMAQDAKLWQVYRPAKPIKDPESGEIIGYEAFYLGTARQTAKGDTATIEIVSARQEIGVGDRLTPATRPEIVNYAPHAPAKLIEGQIAAMYGGVKETGRNSIVTLNRGQRDGLEVGHVLALYRKGGEREIRIEDEKEKYTLPNERYGILFVFRTFERISYALVMDVRRPVAVADIVRTP
jgi:LysM repeat protein